MYFLFYCLYCNIGFTESVVAAAASRIGKNVLHLDPNDFYGCNWASFNLDTLLKYIDGQTNVTDTDEVSIYNCLLVFTYTLIANKI